MCQNWTFKDNFYCKNPLNHFKIELIFETNKLRKSELYENNSPEKVLKLETQKWICGLHFIIVVAIEFVLEKKITFYMLTHALLSSKARIMCNDAHVLEKYKNAELYKFSIFFVIEIFVIFVILSQ